MIPRQEKYTPGDVYNNTKETFIKNWKSKSFLILDSSEDTPSFPNHEISERYMR